MFVQLLKYILLNSNVKEKQNKIMKEKKRKKNKLRLWKEKKTYLVVYGTNLAKVCSIS
jgi:ribosomal protein L18